MVAGANDFGTYVLTVTNLGGAITSKPALLEPATGSLVSVFNDSRYVYTWVSQTGEAFLEQESLWHLGHPVTPFTNIAQAVTNGVLLFPAQEAGALAPDLTVEERSALSNFVVRGGILIVHGSLALGRAAELLNSVFGWNLLEESPATKSYTLALSCTGTVFVTGSVLLEYEFGTTALAADALPPASRPIYSDAGGSTVALLPQGAGTVVFLGWDWINAAPYSGQDGGWLDVLDRATRAMDSPPPTPPPRIINPVYQDSGVFQFDFRGYFLKSYTVLVSTNLVDWEKEGAPSELAPGQFRFQDLLTSHYPARYYRLRQD